MQSAIRTEFAHWDADGDGKISRAEIRALTTKLGHTLSERELTQLMSASDADGDGEIDFEEFTRALAAEVGVARFDLEDAGLPGFDPDLAKYRHRAWWGALGLTALLGAALLATEAWMLTHHLVGMGACVLAALGGVAAVARRRPTLRFALGLWIRGTERWYDSLFGAFGAAPRMARFRSLGVTGAPVLYLRDPELVAAALTDTTTFERSPLVRFRPFNVHSILGAGSGGRWRRYRRATQPWFSKGYVHDLPRVRALVRARVATWPSRGRFGLLDELYRLVTEIRGQVFFDHSFGTLEPDNTMVSIVDELLSYPGILLGGKAGGLRRFHGELLGALRRCERPCSVGGLLRAELDAGRMTEEEALQNASVYALAHAPTFALFWLLGRIGKDGAADTLRTVPGALERAIKEELRIHPPVPALFTRRISTDTKLGDQQIEGGATVVVSPLYVHHNPAVWKEPATFSPERWDLGGKRGAQAVLSSGCPMAALGRYIPFGGGAHRCQGRRYAVEEILLICQEVLAAVDLEVLEDGGLLERPVQEQVKLHVYARPERDITVRATPRP